MEPSYCSASEINEILKDILSSESDNEGTPGYVCSKEITIEEATAEFHKFFSGIKEGDTIAFVEGEDDITKDDLEDEIYFIFNEDVFEFINVHIMNICVARTIAKMVKENILIMAHDGTDFVFINPNGKNSEITNLVVQYNKEH